MLSLSKIAQALGGEVSGRQVLAPGEDHTSADRSLSVKINDAGDDIVVHSFAGDDPIRAKDWVREKLGLPPFQPKGRGKGGPWTTICEYVYHAADEQPYLLVRRCRDQNGGKQFPQFHWDGSQWLKGKPAGPKIPYRLPHLIAAPASTTIYICEGEKDADALAQLGFVATTASEGAGAPWDKALTPHFRDRDVVVLSDADTAGRKHAQKVARALDGVAKSVRVLDLYPERTDGSDVSDFLRKDPSGARLAKLLREAPAWDPPVDDEKQQDDDLIAELAALSTVAYGKRRKEAAKALGIGVVELDKAVAEARSASRREGQPNPQHWDVDPWPEPVATGDLLDDLETLYSRYVILPEHGATAMALWCLHAWALEAAYISPFLMFVSPEPRCGKSSGMALLNWTGPRTVLASNVSPAAIFRYIDAAHPCLLFDEAETFVTGNEEIRGVLNSGHSRDTSFVIRCEGDANEPKRFSTWAPKVIASIGKLAATLRDRAIILPMKRKKRSERVSKLRGRDSAEFRTLRERARRWAEDNVDKLKDANPDLPVDLNDRAADNWEALLAIAELAGDAWPAKARAAAIKLSGDSGETATIGTQLLAAVRAVFEARNVDRITSEALAEILALDKDSPWASYGKGNKPITQRQIATVLERYGVRPSTIRLGQVTKKGYMFAWLADAFETYLDPLSGTTPFQSVTPSQANDGGPNLHFPSVTQESLLRMENVEKPFKYGPCDAVTDQNPLPGENHESGALEGALAPSETCTKAIGLCQQCGGTLDGIEGSFEVGGQTVPLHPECRRFFRDGR
jgi:putative DNA primase/helicase